MAIQSDTARRYTEFVNGLLLSLNTTEYREYAMTPKITEYKLFPAITKVLEKLKYIERRKVNGTNKFEYRAMKKAADVDPKHILILIKTCNTFYTKKSKKTTVKAVTPAGLLKTMNELVVEARSLGDNTRKIYYRNKHKHSEQYDNAQTFAHAVLSGKIVPKDFEEYELIHSPRSVLIERITGNGVISAAHLSAAHDFHTMLVMLSKSDSAGFQKRLYNLKQNAKRAPQTAAGNLKRAQLTEEICQLYIDYKKVPGSRFKGLKLYYTMLKNQKK